MPLRPDPLKELLDLQERMNRLFDDTLGRERIDEPALLHGSWTPLADVLDTPEAYIVELELPGLSQDEIEIQAQADEVAVRGERQSGCPARPEAFHRMERRQGPFLRGFRFPEELLPDRVSAEFENGLLRLTLPKARPGRAVHVRVERGQ